MLLNGTLSLSLSQDIVQSLLLDCLQNIGEVLWVDLS